MPAVRKSPSEADAGQARVEDTLQGPALHAGSDREPQYCSQRELTGEGAPADGPGLYGAALLRHRDKVHTSQSREIQTFQAEPLFNPLNKGGSPQN